MCGSCKKKEDLKLPIPESIDEPLFMEYVANRNYLNENNIFDYFQKLYHTNYVFNPKQVRRAIVNLDNLYYSYLNKNLIFNPPVIAQDEPKIESNTNPQVGSKIIRNEKGRFEKKVNK